MEKTSFNALSTEKFRIKMRPHAIKIYRSIWENCKLEDLRENGVNVHILDKEFGVDSLINLETNQWVSVQEKYRRYENYVNKLYQVMPPIPDFTQEYKNAAGTKFEANGEWFKLGAQLYFYGWANELENNFKAWFILDIVRYKHIVEIAGGLNKIGKLKQNNKHGRASFYAIPCNRIKKAMLFCSNELKELILKYGTAVDKTI